MPDLAMGQQSASGENAHEGGLKGAPAISMQSKEERAKRERPDYVRTNRVMMVGAVPVTVAQLEEALREAHGKRDEEVARDLSGLELRERLNTTRLNFWEAALRGKKARNALEAMADASAFLEPPATDTPAQAPADLAAQRQMLAQTVSYLGKVISKLPDLSVTEEITRYENVSGEPEQDGGAQRGDRSWRLAGKSKLEVQRIGGKVDLAPRSRKEKAAVEEQTGQINGIFGPTLSTVIVDAARGKFTWSRWEPSATGLRADFQYEVPKAESHYQITFPKVGDPGESEEVTQQTGYHGEIAIDPGSGVIYRMTMVADLDAGLSIDRTDVMVEYGPVQMDGNTYILPLKGVTITSGRSAAGEGEGGSSVDEVTALEEIEFGDYRMLDVSAQPAK